MKMNAETTNQPEVSGFDINASRSDHAAIEALCAVSDISAAVASRCP